MKRADRGIKKQIKRRISPVSVDLTVSTKDKRNAIRTSGAIRTDGVIRTSGAKSGSLLDHNLNYNKKIINNIGVLVVNYNNLNYTKDCISDLQNQINKNFDIWLIDQNSSEEGTVEYLKKIEKQEVKVIWNKFNSDLSKVWNYFYNKCESKYLCYLNNDVRVAINFTDDIINLFDKEPQVGVIIHVTNNPKYIKAEQEINYEILNPALSQGWDFCVRREVYTEIPDTLRIFGGDDFIFASLVKKGYKVGFLYSSPIIHYKEKTRVKISTIVEIQKSDANNYWKEVRKYGLTHCNSAVNLGLCNKFPPKGIELIQNKNCIYTAAIGDYDIVGESTFEKQDDWDYICFTDNENMKSDFWKVIYVSNTGESVYDNYKLARYFKTNFYKYLSSYTNIIWKDSRIIINCDLNDYLNLLGEDDFLFMKHYAANSIEEEFERVLKGNLETVEMVEKIKTRYVENGYKYDNGLYATGILLFKNNRRTQSFFKIWWNEIDQFSLRDQLSANYVLYKNPNIKYTTIPQLKALWCNAFFNTGKRKSKRLTY